MIDKKVEMIATTQLELMLLRPRRAKKRSNATDPRKRFLRSHAITLIRKITTSKNVPTQKTSHNLGDLHVRDC